MIANNPKNQFLIEPKQQQTREFLARGGSLMKKIGAAVQSTGLFIAIKGAYSKNPWIATFGIVSSWCFRDLCISGRNMERLMGNETQLKALAMNSQSWEEFCCRRTLFLGPYVRYMESKR